VRYHQTTLILLLSLSSNPFAIAANKTVNEFALCKPFTKITLPRPELPPVKNNAVRLFADNAVVQEKLGISTCSGNVFIQRADQILNTPLLTYDIKKDVINADGEFVLWDNNFIISGNKIQLDQEEQGEMADVNYWLLNRRARGIAKKLFKKTKDIIQLEQASLTTCDPNDEIWRLNANDLTLDNAKAEGTAHHVTIRFLDTPVFYTPYLSFPLGKRKSGILVPNIGNSDETGFEFSLPYYFNLAPNYDWTVTPRLMSRRGLLLRNEFRYLTSLTEGNLKLEYLPQDQVSGEDRTSLAFRHNGSITKQWLTDVNINYISDERYFEELGNNITIASLTHLEQRGDLYYSGNGWLGIGRVQKFQTLSNKAEARPYQRLPQFLFKTNLPEFNRQFNFALNAELVHFDRNTNIVAGPIGNRLDVKPSLSFPWRNPGAFVVPQLSLRYTQYNLDNVNPDDNTAPNRFLYTFSTDSGLFLERDVNLLNTELVQTLEPRLFYRYTPHQDQDELPIFDTGRYDLSFGQLFRDNNYSSADRVDDAHQMAFGLTSRLLNNNTGMEYLRANIGQAFYFRDRQVTLLPTEKTETDSTSLIITELASQLTNNWRVSSTFRWNPHTDNTEHTVLRTRYYADKEHIFNMSYRLRDTLLEQTDVSFHWSLNPRWNILGRWNFSLPDRKNLEIFSGLEYDSCCWAIRFIARRYLNSINNSDYSNSFFLQFELKGLGGIGRKTDSFLEEQIYGYESPF
jgi:LPS-assembly protein